MDQTFLTAVIAAVLSSGVVTVIITTLANRRKDRATAVKLLAEAGHIETETDSTAIDNLNKIISDTIPMLEKRIERLEKQNSEQAKVISRMTEDNRDKAKTIQQLKETLGEKIKEIDDLHGRLLRFSYLIMILIKQVTESGLTPKVLLTNLDSISLDELKRLAGA